MMNRITEKAHELNVELIYDVCFTGNYNAMVYANNTAFVEWLKQNATAINSNGYETYYKIDNMTIKVVDDEF